MSKTGRAGCQDDAAPAPRLTEFLLELSRLLVSAGDAISDVDVRLRRIAARWAARTSSC